MPVKRLVGDKVVDVYWSERRDTGGMFEASVGVYKDDSGYVAFVTDWGWGVKSPPHPTLEEARTDAERLFDKAF